MRLIPVIAARDTARQNLPFAHLGRGRQQRAPFSTQSCNPAMPGRGHWRWGQEVAGGAKSRKSLCNLYAVRRNRSRNAMRGLLIDCLHAVTRNHFRPWRTGWCRSRQGEEDGAKPMQTGAFAPASGARKVSTVTDPEPDSRTTTLRIGQDAAGHWLVQESSGRLEGRFISFAAAMAFARAERHGFPGACIAVATAPLVPQISFAPVAPWETASRYARSPAPVQSMAESRI